MGQVVGISPSAAARIRRVGPVEILIGLLVVIFALQPVLVGLFDGAAVQAWSTVFVAVVVQAVPFLVLGVVVSALIATYVPASFFRRVLPRSTMAAVPAAGLAGAVLPGCECASVPISARLISREVPPAAALAFLLSAPAINPVVLVATAVAFPGRPEVVAARFAASLGAAVIVGWIWARFGRAKWTAAAKGSAEEPETGQRVATFLGAARHDFLQSGGFLVIGALTSATLNTVVPRSTLGYFSDHEWLAVPALGLLAVILAICSEADAFVASSLTQFSLTARLAFLVVGPMVDVKLIAMQAGTFGRAFVVRFAPLVFVVGIGTSIAVGQWLL